MTRNLLFVILIFSVVLLSRPVTAAELSGTVYSQGSPVANLTIAVKETSETTKTGSKGEYRLDLSPGKYTLIIRGQEFSVTVGPGPSRRDIQL